MTHPFFSSAEQLRNSGLKFDGFVWEDQTNRTLRKQTPLYEAKMIHHFDHRWSGYSIDDVSSLDYSAAYKAIPSNEAVPRYWVEDVEVRRRITAKGWTRRWLMGWRDITNATNERTVIASMVPWTGVGHTLRLMHVGNSALESAAFLANASAIVFDFVARQKVGGTHLTVEMWKQLPVLSPDFYTEPRIAFITPKVLELTYTSDSLAPFARDLGHDGPPFAWAEGRRADLRADLDAFYARAYDLTRDELRYILDPADVKGPDYPSETFRVLKEKEIRTHGEYRTQRLVLAAWDRMEADGTFVDLGLTDAVVSSADAPPSIDLPVFASLRDGAWAWPAQTLPQDRLRNAAQYALWLIDPVQDAPITRLLVASLAEPALLTPLLPEEDRGHWIRLAGEEVRPMQGATRLRPQINAAWRTAFNTLISSGQLGSVDNHRVAMSMAQRCQLAA